MCARLAEVLLQQCLPDLVAVRVNIAAGDFAHDASAWIDDRVAIMGGSGTAVIEAEAADLELAPGFVGDEGGFADEEGLVELDVGV